MEQTTGKETEIVKNAFYSMKKRLHTKLYIFLQKHPFWDALRYLLRNRRNREMCMRLAGRDGLALKCSTLGGKNKDKNIYYIKFGKSDWGFFAQYHILLKYLYIAYRFHFEAVVEWDRCIPYAEREPVNGTENPFEYYFDQPSGISIQEAKESYNVFFAEKAHLENSYLNREIEDGEQGYVLSEEMMRMLGKIASGYIRLNADMKSYMDAETAKILNGKRTLGVHYRGSDYKQNYYGHPIAVDVERYVDAAERLMEQGRYEQIFLATDDEEALQRFQKKFGGRLRFYQDIVRSENDVSVAFGEADRKHHRYLLGREVLRDMLTLSECDALVAGISKVSICAQITKYSRGQEYELKKILFEGINQNLKYFRVE